MTEKKKEKPYRGFNDKGDSYYIAEQSWKINKDIMGDVLVEWKDRLNGLTDITKKQIIKVHDESQALAKDILTLSLIDFDYDGMLKKCHPKELEGVAGNIYTFLWEIGSVRERELLTELSMANLKP